MKKLRRPIAVAALVLGACQGSEPQIDEQVQLAGTKQALHGEVSAMQWSIDAPWRIEPELGGEDQICGDPPCSPPLRYGAVPISIVFRDVYQENQHRRVESVKVEEVGTGLPAQTLGFGAVHEVEYTVGAWRQESGPGYNGPPHTLCRGWQGEDCSRHNAIADTSEWDAVFMYSLRQPKLRGSEIKLKVSMDVWVLKNPGTASQVEVLETFTNALTVRLGHPLPRFEGGWSYGDLHYHSQGTDNEGESGYSHRMTLQAMSAIGLDFAFATEHASNSGQFADLADFVPTPDMPLRDMSQRRWAFLLRGLHGPGGANLEVSSYPRRRTAWSLAVPQLFLGGEVDVIPEISASEQRRGVIDRPFSGSYRWMNACREYPAHQVWDSLPNILHPCPNEAEGDLTEPARDFPGGPVIPDRFFVKDLQGPYQRLFGRQHLLHLAGSSTDEQAFVPSNTNKWGGATRRLATLLNEEYTQGRKGVTFLAHPTEYASGTDISRLGPDIMPFSLSQLDDAFRNRSVLGLQVWNEDSHLYANTHHHAWNGEDAIGDQSIDPYQDQIMSTWPEVHELSGAHTHMHLGFIMADEMMRWGLDPVRRVAAGVAGHRKVFIAGGSDAHGDLNYSRKGYFTGLKTINDTAMGKPRNLVFTGQPEGPTLGESASPLGASGRGVSQAQVVAGLQSGNFIVTDGPIVRIGIDLNHNNVFDDGDIPMGGNTTWGRIFDHLQGEETLPILVEWRSTPEFGPVSKVDLYVGAFNNATGMSLTYAPEYHGFGPWGAKDPLSYGGHYMTKDGYWVDPSGQLRVEVPQAEGYGGVRRIDLRPSSFPAGRGRIGENPCDRTCDPRHNPNCDTDDFDPCNPEAPRYFDSAPASSLYVRAMAMTNGLSPDCDYAKGHCAPRLAFTNPVWASYAPLGIALEEDPILPDRVWDLSDFNTGICLDRAADVLLGGFVQRSCQHDEARELFSLVPTTTDYEYLVQARPSGQCLDAVEDKHGNMVGLAECAPDLESQRFVLQAQKDKYRVVSVTSGQCLGMSSPEVDLSQRVGGEPAKIGPVSCDDEGAKHLLLSAPSSPSEGKIGK